MANQKSNAEIEKIKLFITKLMNEEQDKYSAICKELNLALDTAHGTITAIHDTRTIIGKIFNAKIQMLEKVLNMIQDL